MKREGKKSEEKGRKGRFKGNYSLCKI